MKTKYSIEEKRTKEKELITVMVGIYCKGMKHGSPHCPECQELLAYAHKKIDRCPFMETKTFCSSCKVHCYSADKREQIRCVMKYAGPRMLTVHPIFVFKHMVNTMKVLYRKENSLT
jgi:uncharacterized Fe-S cluster-containing protein